MESQTLYPRFRHYYRSLVPLFEKPKVAAYTMLILSFFTVAIFGSFAIRPTLATIGQLQKKIEDQKLVNERMDQKIQQLREAQAEYRSIEQDLTAIFDALPDTPQAAFLLGKLNRVLVDNNIDVTIFQISSVVLSRPENPSSSSGVIGFTLSGKASYEDILLFIDFLSQTDRLLTIDSIEISAIPASTQTKEGAFTRTDLLNISIRGKSYVLWEKQSVDQERKGGSGG